MSLTETGAADVDSQLRVGGNLGCSSLLETVEWNNNRRLHAYVEEEEEEEQQNWGGIIKPL